jgi:hypothetical protein
LIFGKAELGGVSARTLLALLVAVYSLLTAVPTAFLALSIIQGYAAFKIVVLAFLMLILFYSLATKKGIYEKLILC